MPNNTEWICDNCYSVMEVTKEGRNRYKVECPECWTCWYVDEDCEMINDGSAWSPNDEEEDLDDEDFELADFCRGGDLTED